MLWVLRGERYLQTPLTYDIFVPSQTELSHISYAVFCAIKEYRKLNNFSHFFVLLKCMQLFLSLKFS